MKQNLIVGVLCIAMTIPLVVRSQTITQNPHTPLSDQAVCPGEIITYTISGFGTCGILWTSTSNGTISGSNTGTSVTVTWADTPGTATITANLSGCGNGSTLEGTKPSVSHVILSVKGQSFDPLGYNPNPRSIDFCTRTQVDLYISHMYVQGTGGIAEPPQQEVNYQWALPSGWKELNSNATGTVTTAVNFISIVPSKCAVVGNVIVTGVIGNCSAPDTPSKSIPVTFVLNGVSPILTFSPQAGYAGSTACNTTPVTFTATLSPPLSCSSSYSWIVPPSWRLISQSGNTASLQPSGNSNDSGPIKASVNFSCGTTITSGPYTPPWTQPSIGGPGAVCATGQFTLQNAPSATPTWSSSNPNGLYINPSTGAATRVNSFNGTVSISASVNCGSVQITPKQVIVGYPFFTSITLDGTSPLWYSNCSTGSIPFTVGPQPHILETNLSGSDYSLIYFLKNEIFSFAARNSNRCLEGSTSTPHCQALPTNFFHR